MEIDTKTPTFFILVIIKMKKKEKITFQMNDDYFFNINSCENDKVYTFVLLLTKYSPFISLSATLKRHMKEKAIQIRTIDRSSRSLPIPIKSKNSCFIWLSLPSKNICHR